MGRSFPCIDPPPPPPPLLLPLAISGWSLSGGVPLKIPTPTGGRGGTPQGPTLSDFGRGGIARSGGEHAPPCMQHRFPPTFPNTQSICITGFLCFLFLGGVYFFVVVVASQGVRMVCSALHTVPADCTYVFYVSDPIHGEGSFLVSEY